MLKKQQLTSYLYFDTETKPAYKSFEDMPISLQKIWLKKYHQKAYLKQIEEIKNDLSIKSFLSRSSNNCIVDLSDVLKSDIEEIILPTVNEVFIKESGLHPEFSKIFCISFGVFTEKSYDITLGTLQEDNEKEMLIQFISVLKSHNDLNLFGYNINEFDIPFLLKRIWINGLTGTYPRQLQLGDAKPWTVKHFDMMQAFKSLSWAPTSLDLLCEILEVPTPKDNFSNSEFTTLISSGKITIDEAIKYCEKDVKAMMLCALKLSSDESNYFPEAKVAYKKSVE